MSKRYEVVEAISVNIQMVNPQTEPQVWDWQAPADGERALIVGDPWASAMAVIGDTPALEHFTAALAARVAGGHPRDVVDLARRLYLGALRVADRGAEADLIDMLQPRTYAPDTTDGRTGTECVVDMYGVTFSVVPTTEGTTVQVTTGEAPYRPLRIVVDGADAGTWAEW